MMVRRRRPNKTAKKRKSAFPLWIAIVIVIAVGAVLIIFGNRKKHPKANEKNIKSAEIVDSSSIDFITRIDGAIMQAACDLGVSDDNLRWKRNKEIEQFPNTKFSNITMTVNSAFPMAHINYVLQHTIVDSGGRIMDAFDKKSGTELTIKVGYGGISTHQIKIRRRNSATIEPAYVALLIDDFGYYPVPIAKKFFELGIKFDASILPQGEYTQYILRELKNYDKIERMVHIPMEPKNYPKVDPGGGAIFVSMTDHEILRQAEKDISAIPGAVGANNHMGSRATENKRVMYQVLRAVRDAGLFWVDSRTTPYSVSEEVAITMKIPAVHIDHIIDPPIISADEIEQRLYRYCLDARRMPAMIINCHSSDTTYQILKKNLPTLKKYGIEFITVSEAIAKKSTK
ncbi:hypothetical protein DRQ26_01910 [bacterium]|nr:MAG: hypothetical protein DRQ26_01910 [bacterium]